MPGQGRHSSSAESTAQRHARKRRSDDPDRSGQGHNKGGFGKRSARAVPYARHSQVERTVDLRDLIRRADPQVPGCRAAQLERGTQLPDARVHRGVRRGDGDHPGQRDAVRSPEPGGDSNGLVARAARASSRGDAEPSRGVARVPAASTEGGRSCLDAASGPAASGSAQRPDVAPRGEQADRRGALEDSKHVSSERDISAPRALPELGRDGDALARYRDQKDRGASGESLNVGGRRAVSFACAVAFAEKEGVDMDTAWYQLVSAARFEAVDKEGLPICSCGGLFPEIVVALAEVLTPSPPREESAVDRAAAQFKRAALRTDFVIEQSRSVRVRPMQHEELWESTETGPVDRLAARQITQLTVEAKADGGIMSLLRFDPIQADSEGIARLVQIQRTVRVLQRNGVIVRDWVSPLALQTLAIDKAQLVPILALDAVDAQILTGTYVVQMACLGHVKFRECMINVLVDTLCNSASHERVLWRALACVTILLARSQTVGTESQLPLGVGQLLRERCAGDSVGVWTRAVQPQVLQILMAVAPVKEKIKELNRLLSCMLNDSEVSPATPVHAPTREMTGASRPSTPDASVFPVSPYTRRTVRSCLRNLAISVLGAFPPLLAGDNSVLGLGQFVLLGGTFPVPTDLVPKGSERVFMRSFVSPLIGSTYIDTSECRDVACVKSCKRLLHTTAKLREVFPYKVSTGKPAKAPLASDTFRRLNTRNGSAVDRPLYELNQKKRKMTGASR